MKKQLRLISIIIPIYNEEKNVPLIVGEIKTVWEKIKDKYDHEIIFINDGSHDGSEKVIEKLAEKDKKIKYIAFSRNFGKEIALTAGIHIADGDAAIMIDADLQHPPKLIPEFIEKWEAGADIVIGVRIKNQGEGFVKKTGSYFFYKIARAICDTKLKERETDYRLIDRCVIDEFNNFTERSRIARGLIDWLGFERDFIFFNANERSNGTARYSPIKLYRLAASTFISHSLLPLKLAGWLGIFITLFSGTFGLFILIEKYILHDPWNMYFSGSATLAVIILFLVGIILICLGLVCLYIANIHGEVTNRPIYVIKKRINFNKK